MTTEVSAMNKTMNTVMMPHLALMPVQIENPKRVISIRIPKKRTNPAMKLSIRSS